MVLESGLSRALPAFVIAKGRIVIGSFAGLSSPVPSFTDTLYARHPELSQAPAK